MAREYRYPKSATGKLRGVGPNGRDVMPGDPPFPLDEPLDPMLARAGVVPVEDEAKVARERGNLEALIAQLREDNASLGRRALLAEGRLDRANDRAESAKGAEVFALEQLAEREVRIARLEEQATLLQAELEASRRPAPPWATAATATVLAFANAQRASRNLERFAGAGAVSRAEAWLNDDRDAFESAWGADG